MGGATQSQGPVSPQGSQQIPSPQGLHQPCTDQQGYMAWASSSLRHPPWPPAPCACGQLQVFWPVCSRQRGSLLCWGMRREGHLVS